MPKLCLQKSKESDKEEIALQQKMIKRAQSPKQAGKKGQG
jgi:hypothetical protein